MVSKLALVLVFHLIILGVWMARWKGTDKLSFWWKPGVYLLSFYVILGFILSIPRFSVIIAPGE